MSQNTMSDINFKALNGQFNIDEAQGIVECFVAAIGNKDSVGDVIISGAFTESLKRRKPRVVWGHSWNDPIGKVLEIYEVPANDPRLPAKMKQAGVGGVYARVQFNLATEKGREAFSSVAFFGPEQEWSIGYKTLNATFDPNVQANILREVELYEVSPVLHGANQLTGTISVKSDEGEKCHGPMGMPNMPGMMGGQPTPSVTPRIVSVDANRLSPIRVISGIAQQPQSEHRNNIREDIFGEGEARPLSDEARNMLAMELMTRSRANLDVIYATENSVVFNREVGQGNNITYRLSYHREPESGEYMFGKPEKIGMHNDESRLASTTVVPSQMPSMPMMVKPQAVNPYSVSGVPSAIPQMGNYGMEKSLGNNADVAADFVLAEIQSGSISSSTGSDKIDAVIEILQGMTGKSAPQQVFTIACEPHEAFYIKSAIDPILDYHRLDAEIDEHGIHVVNGLSKESIDALTKAAKSIDTIVTKDGGSKKYKRP
jgi:HK97 family phage prohead protease